VLDNGVVAEAGSHAQLLAAGGRYADLWARQQTVDDLIDGGDNGSGGDAAEGKGAKGPQQQRAR
jgi:ATP-binding cassette subfamily B protein